MEVQAIADYIYCVHADIKTTELFEGIWPIPHGVSLNAYVVKGEKTALIDLFRDWSGAVGQVEEALASIGIKFSGVDSWQGSQTSPQSGDNKVCDPSPIPYENNTPGRIEDSARCIDYLILNHLEPDHTDWLKEFRAKNPKAEIISTKKGLDLVRSFYKIDTGVRAVKDGDSLDLGGGRVLSFFETPNVHWPETMVTWDAASGTLFSCDAFGSYGALGDKVFDDQCDEKEHAFFEGESLRYYANIVSSFSTFVERAIAKLAGLDIKCVAPSHGLVWRKKPREIINRYAKYASWAKGPAEREIAVIWSSMYGNTKAGVDAVVRGIEKEGVPYTLHRAPDEDASYALAAAYKSSGLVIAMPTYEYAMFPPMAYVLDVFRRKHIFGKKALRIGSWGWVGGAKKEYDAVLANFKWDSLESYEWAGYPAETDLQILEERGRELARKL